MVSAIIMAQRGEDPLAIHVVTASALNGLRDLIKKAGDEYVEQVLNGAFTIASAQLPASPEIIRIRTNMKRRMHGLNAIRFFDRCGQKFGDISTMNPVVPFFFKLFL